MKMYARSKSNVIFLLLYLFSQKKGDIWNETKNRYFFFFFFQNCQIFNYRNVYVERIMRCRKIDYCCKDNSKFYISTAEIVTGTAFLWLSFGSEHVIVYFVYTNKLIIQRFYISYGIEFQILCKQHFRFLLYFILFFFPCEWKIMSTI